MPKNYRNLLLGKRSNFFKISTKSNKYASESLAEIRDFSEKLHQSQPTVSNCRNIFVSLLRLVIPDFLEILQQLLLGLSRYAASKVGRVCHPSPDNLLYFLKQLPIWDCRQDPRHRSISGKVL